MVATVTAFCYLCGGGHSYEDPCWHLCLKPWYRPETHAAKERRAAVRRKQEEKRGERG